jgi:ATP-dependent DNA ligase
MLTKKDFMLCHSTNEEEALKLDTNKWKANFKWDGERIIAIIDKGQVLLLNRRGFFKNEQFREVVAGLRTLPDCILDGEVISTDNNFNRLQSRAGTQDRGKLEILEKTIPVEYQIFDMLTADGKSITAEPLRSRLERLNALGIDNPCLKICLYGDIKTLLEEAKTKNMEGIIVKNMDARYESRRSHNWLKLKLWKEAEIEITSYAINNAGIRAEDKDGNAVQIAGSQSEPIKTLLNTQGRCTIYVQYLEKTVKGRMRFPSFRGLKK